MQTNITKYLDKIKTIQANFLEFLENSENIEENFKNLKRNFEEINIQDNKNDLRLFLHLISSISENHHHIPLFFSKIERTLLFFKDDIKKFYSNSEIFNIFSNNKRILLFLNKEGIIIFDEFIVKNITTTENMNKFYPQYFVPEIRSFFHDKCIDNKDLDEILEQKLPDDFNEMREKGENDNYICELIREDLVEEFIKYFHKECISSDATIKPSVYETNSFLLKYQNVTLIEYAAFFGSIQIFNFLKNEKAELNPSLMIEAIHSENAELICLLEEIHVELDVTIEDCYIESIKCHHNDITNYFINKSNKKEDEISNDILYQCLESYNFTFLQNDHINESLFGYLCCFDYYTFVKILLTSEKTDVNSIAIQYHIL